MSKSLYQFVRPFVPNFRLKIHHVEPDTELNVRLRQHLGLIAKGSRNYESRYVETLRAATRHGDTVFDVGANIGFYSVLFSRWVGVVGEVVAFEPDPNNVDLLNQNLSANDCANVMLRESALGREPGSGPFSIDGATGSTGHLGCGPTYAETIFGNGRERLVDVEISTLDREAEIWGAPSVIKLDIEGGEFDVLCGGVSVLEHHRPLIVSELNAWSHDISTNTQRAEFATRLLDDYGYLLWDLDTGARVKAGEMPWMILAIPKERTEEARISEVLRRAECVA